MVGIWIMLGPYGKGNTGCTSAHSELRRSRAIALSLYWAGSYATAFVDAFLTPRALARPRARLTNACLSLSNLNLSRYTELLVVIFTTGAFYGFRI